MTYVSEVSGPGLTADSSTHYSAGYETLVIYEQANEFLVLKQKSLIECEPGSSREDILEKSLSGDSFVGGQLQLSNPIQIGKT